jgi:hypothetical protein
MSLFPEENILTKEIDFFIGIIYNIIILNILVSHITKYYIFHYVSGPYMD